MWSQFRYKNIEGYFMPPAFFPNLLSSSLKHQKDFCCNAISSESHFAEAYRAFVKSVKQNGMGMKNSTVRVEYAVI